MTEMIKLIEKNEENKQGKTEKGTFKRNFRSFGSLYTSPKGRSQSQTPKTFSLRFPARVCRGSEQEKGGCSLYSLVM